MSPKGERLKDEGSKRQVITAGAVAGLISRFVIAPLDVVKIRLQLQPSSLSDPLAPKRATRRTTSTIRHIFQNEGLTGFWKGNVPAELMYLCYGALQFGTYRTVTLALHSGFEGKLPNAAESFVAGASAGALATSVTYPLDLLRTRFAAQGSNKIYGSLLGAVRDIRRDEGMKGFFRGIGPGLAQIIPFMGIFFVSYESLRLVLGDMNMPWGSGDATAGAIGSVIAKTSVFPLDLVRKRIQVQGPTRSKYVYGNIPEYKSAVRALSMIVKADGIRGLYKGLSISLIKSAPASAVTVWTYERALHAIISYENKSEAIP